MKAKLIAAAAMTVSALMISGMPLHATESKDRPAESTMGEKMDDATITSKVKMELMRNPATSALNTEVDTSGGVVTLTGKAKNRAEKELATQIAKKTKGVVKVNNQMVIDTTR